MAYMNSDPDTVYIEHDLRGIPIAALVSLGIYGGIICLALLIGAILS